MRFLKIWGLVRLENAKQYMLQLYSYHNIPKRLLVTVCPGNALFRMVYADIVMIDQAVKNSTFFAKLHGHN